MDVTGARKALFILNMTEKKLLDDKAVFEASAPLWLYQGKAAWHFITLPVDIAARIRFLTTGPRHGWGAIRVKICIGASVWETSIFPDKKSDSYLLPVKAEIRRQEKLVAGQLVDLRLELI